MSAVAVILLLSAVGNATLGLYVLFRHAHTTTIRLFSAFTFAVAFWNLTHVGLLTATTYEAQVPLGRIAFFWAPVIVALFVTFTWYFPETPQPRVRRSLVWFVWGVALLFAGLSFTPLIQADVAFTDTGSLPMPGPLHPFYSIWIMSGFVWGTANLITSRATSPPGRERMQLNYSLTGFVLAFLAIFASHLSLPAVLGTNELRFVGFASPLIWTVLTAYSIVRYRLMDIGIALRSTAIYGIVGVVLWMFFLVPFAAYPFVKPYIGESAGTMLLLGLAVVLAFIVAPLRDKTQRFVDRRLFKGRYDHRAAMVHFGEALSGTYSRESIAQVVAEELPILCRAATCAVYLVEEEGGACRLAASYRPEGWPAARLPERLPSQSALVQALRDSRQRLNIDDWGKVPVPWRKRRNELERSLHEHQALCALPLVSKGRMHGFVTLGERTDDNMYTAQELDHLQALAASAALALDNAALFDEQVAVKRHYETILRHMQRGVLSVRADLRIRTLNASGAEMLGLSAANWIGLQVGELHPFFEEVLVRTMTDERNRPPGECSLEWRGRVFPCEYETSLLRDGRGNVSGAALVFQDLTEKKTFEAEAQRVDRLASVGTLAAGLAHEIKNPLVAIQTFTQLLPERYAESDFRDQFATVVGSEVERINSLVQNMLDLARSRPEVVADLRVHDVLEQVLALLSYEFKKYGIDVCTRFDQSLPKVRGSVQQMHQVFLNLVQNAVEAMAQDGGELTLVTGLVNGESNTAGAHEKAAPMVRVAVKDSGCGMTKEQVQRIFDPFFSTKANGSGLGLSNCLTMLERQNASLSVESEPAAGSVFTVLLPVASPDQDEEGGTPS